MKKLPDIEACVDEALAALHAAALDAVAGEVLGWTILFLATAAFGSLVREALIPMILFAFSLAGVWTVVAAYQAIHDCLPV